MRCSVPSNWFLLWPLIWPSMQVVDPVDDYLLDIEVFGRLTAENMRYGPVQRAPGEPLILAQDDNVPENMSQGEFGTCYLLSVLQCQSMMLSKFYPPQNIVQAYDMRAGVFACRFWHLGQVPEFSTIRYLSDTLLVPVADRGGG